MAPGVDDSFNGASRSLFGPFDAEEHENLMTHFENLDLPMVDSGSAERLNSLQHASAHHTDDEDAEASQDELELTVEERSDRISTLLHGEDEGDQDTPVQKQEFGSPVISHARNRDQAIAIKQEENDSRPNMNGFANGEIIDICDSDDDVEVVPRNMSSWKYGTTMDDGAILLSDGEDDQEIIIVYDDGTTAVNIKKEDADVELLGATEGLVPPPESESSSDDDEHVAAPAPNLGNSVLRRPNPRAQRHKLDNERMFEVQRQLAARSLGKAVLPGTGSVFAAPRTPGKDFINPTNENNEYDWMSNTVLPEDPSINFVQLKRAYKLKRKARTNTIKDDVDFTQAQKAEKDRIRKFVNASDSESQAEDSEDGLFIPQRHLGSSILDQRLADFMDDRIDADDGGKGAHRPSKEEIDNLLCNTVDWSNKKSRKKYLEQQLRANMMAGFEPHLHKGQKRHLDKITKKAVTEEAGDQGAKTGKGKKNSKTKANSKNAKAAKPTRTATGRMNDVASLLTSNIYEDSNANLDANLLPVITEKKKKEFMTALIANVPLDDQRQARSDKADVVKASKILWERHVKPDGNGSWHMTGMKTSLYHYQVQGAAYMKKREIGDQEPCGGILADQMGLGKTVMMLATMIANRPKNVDEPKCTLIVCSPALMTQWEREIETHAEAKIFRRVTRHHANNKFSGLGAEEEMQKADIILTTYGEVVRSYPRCLFPADIKEMSKKEEWWYNEWSEERGLLHRAFFYRVVLDEAQTIKNHASQTSIACRALMAEHRWALSGTPIQNKLDELFPYFKFLRVRHTGSIHIFRHNFCAKDNDVCNKRLHSILEGTMIRRTHQNKLFGAPLIQLPKNTQETITLEFSNLEMAIYQKVRERCIKAINASHSQDATPEERVRMIMAMFQRLRQMVSHVFMAQEVIEKEYKISDVNELVEEYGGDEDEETLESQMLSSLRKMIDTKGEMPEDAQEADIVPQDDMDPKALKISKPGPLTKKFASYLRLLAKRKAYSKLKERILCQQCGEKPVKPLVLDCLHLYCKECLKDAAHAASADGLEETPCPKCGKIFHDCQKCKGLKELEATDLSASPFLKTDVPQPKKNFQVNMNFVDSRDKLLLSTKLIAVKEQLKRWRAESPDTKIIVFTEWHMVMHLMGRLCQQQGWKCCHYNGKMSNGARDRALNAFQDDPELKIMVASLKCGGTGLNLTVASKVICVDLWFNSCVEEQAFCRVHRIGQTSETYITRFIVAGTVDERLIAMQKEKKLIIEGVMDDRTVLSKLTIDDLMKLFGPVAYDENSKPFILVDDTLTGKKKRSHSN